MECIDMLIRCMNTLEILVDLSKLLVNDLLMSLDVHIVHKNSILILCKLTIQEIESVLESLKCHNHMCLDPLMMLILFLHEEHLGGIEAIDVVCSIIVWNMHPVVMHLCLVILEHRGVLILVKLGVSVDLLHHLWLIPLLRCKEVRVVVIIILVTIGVKCHLS